ncbi:MAG: N-acetylornithine carbamoyltransferase [Bradyrhizobiaceae bacterium]|nr:N-acetylornithine carbamoyltransferase [Bradyrhizobiaceae bacterium]
MRSFTSVHDVASIGIPTILEQATQFVENPWSFEHLGKRKTLGLLFMNPSLRTRMSTQKAATLLGMDTMVLNAGADSWTLETRDGVVMDGTATEHIKDAAAVMGKYCDVLGIRTFAGLTDYEADYAEVVLQSFIDHSGVPVISLESATRHPLQSLADLITIHQHSFIRRPKVVLTWAPHPRALPQAVANSFAEWMLHADVDLTIVNPEGYDLDPRFTAGAVCTHDQDEALTDADVVYAKNWSATTPYGAILTTDPSWCVTKQKLALTNNARFMHCLPVRRNVIVADEVLDSPQSIVIQQAANRVVSAQVVLYNILRSMQ